MERRGLGRTEVSRRFAWDTRQEPGPEESPRDSGGKLAVERPTGTQSEEHHFDLVVGESLVASA